MREQRLKRPVDGCPAQTLDRRSATSKPLRPSCPPSTQLKENRR